MNEKRHGEGAKSNRGGRRIFPSRRQRAPMRPWIDSAILLMAGDVAAHGVVFLASGRFEAAKIYE